MNSQGLCFLVSTRVLVSSLPLNGKSGPQFLCLRNADFCRPSPQLCHACRIPGIQASLRGGFSCVDNGMAENASCYLQFRDADTNISCTDHLAKSATVPIHLGERHSFDEPAHGGGPADSKGQQSKKSIKKLKQLQAYLELWQQTRQWEKEALKTRTEAERLQSQSLSSPDQELLAHEQAKRERVQREQHA